MMEPAVSNALGALPANPGSVEVLGDGPLAKALRARLKLRAGGGRRPVAVIETTGDVRAVQDALRRVADLGTVVLAGPPPPDPVALDLYADLHVRGLTLVGTSSRPGDAP
jgi:threonine dehydrogenase-like Zn-dependent dehydrogenase